MAIKVCDMSDKIYVRHDQGLMLISADMELVGDFIRYALVPCYHKRNFSLERNTINDEVYGYMSNTLKFNEVAIIDREITGGLVLLKTRIEENNVYCIDDMCVKLYRWNHIGSGHIVNRFDGMDKEKAMSEVLLMLAEAKILYVHG